MDDGTAPGTFLERWGEVSDLGTASAVLAWDQETMMPPRGQGGRGRVLATLAALRHERLCDPALTDVVEEAASRALPGSVLAAQVREARRAVRHAVAIPQALERATAEHQSRCLASWQEAHTADALGAFADDLAEMVRLRREAAAALVDAGIAAHPYDALLDEFEPGATEADLAVVLGDLQQQLVPLVAAVGELDGAIDDGAVRGELPIGAQERFARRIAERMGYAIDAGRLDASAHPFTTGFGPGDVRITWRADEHDLRPGLFGVMHEVGHALYEQGLPPELDGTPAGGAASLGVHESQSRLWENQVGRSRGFWSWALPMLHAELPALAGTTVASLWPALHVVRPSLIRVEADEVTYNLHVVLRFEIERRLLSGELEVPDVRDAWDETCAALLGVRPAGVADGVAQDIHWAMGAIGYFPTYAIGNLLAAQLYSAADRAVQVTDAVAAGELDVLLDWLRREVHAHAGVLPVAELIERATGAPLRADDLLAHLRGDIEAAYGIDLGTPGTPDAS